MRVAAEDVDAAEVAVGDRGERTEHRVDDGRLVAPGGLVGTDADLREADALRFLEDVRDVGQGRIEGAEGGIGLREVADPLVATLDGVFEHGDRRGADGVLGGPGELLPAGKPNLQEEEFTVGSLDPAQRNS